MSSNTENEAAELPPVLEEEQPVVAPAEPVEKEPTPSPPTPPPPGDPIPPEMVLSYPGIQYSWKITPPGYDEEKHESIPELAERCFITTPYTGDYPAELVVDIVIKKDGALTTEKVKCEYLSLRGLGNVLPWGEYISYAKEKGLVAADTEEEESKST